MKRSTATFSSCAECGNDRPNYSGICSDCAPLYAPLVDDVQPSDPTRCGECLPCRSDLAKIAPCEGAMISAAIGAGEG